MPHHFSPHHAARQGQDCKHIQCFDLESYLQLNCERSAWRCPVCGRQALHEGLEVDQYFLAILQNLLRADVDEVTIDQLARVRPIPLHNNNPPIKEEPDLNNGQSPSRHVTLMYHVIGC